MQFLGKKNASLHTLSGCLMWRNS